MSDKSSANPVKPEALRPMAALIGFIVHPTYKVRNREAFVQLYGRLEDGKSFLTVSRFKPYFYIRKADLQKALKVSSFVHEPSKMKSFSEEPLTRVVLHVPSEVKPLRDSLQKQGIHCFEADIRFEYRFMIDHFLQGGVKITPKQEPRPGDKSKGEYVDVVFEDPTLETAEYFPKNLKLLSFDIETDMKAKNLFSLSVVCDDLKKVIIVSDKKLKNAEPMASERALLERFKELVSDLDPDIITGWHMIDFDLKILEDKFKQYKIPFVLGRSDDPAKIRIMHSFFQDSKAEITGRMALDGIQMLKNNFISLDDYKLNTAAKHFLGETKLLEGDDRGKEIEEAYKSNQQLLVDYNLKDSELVLRIIDKSTALALSIQRSILAGMPLDRVRASIASLDSVYLKELKKRGYVAPSSGFEEDDEEGAGGYVMQSKPGIYDYIIVCDFKSLYPSIMRTFNIDPLNFVPESEVKKYEKDNKDGKNGLVRVPSGAHFRNTAGIMPDIIERLLAQREKARKEKNEYARFAIKILMNSFYGVLANPMCRFYSRDMANAITLTGQHLIKLVAKKVEEEGFEVIYGDTDSIFVNLKLEDKNDRKNIEQAHKTGDKIAKDINSFFEEHIKKDYGRKNHLELEFEKVYKRFIMPKVRGSDIGSKKRYAGLKVDEKGSEKLEFVGLEFVRRDWTDLAKNFQKELLDRIFHKQEVTGYIKQIVEEVRAGKHDGWLIYRKALRKDVDEYTKTTPPHVKAARILGKDLDSSLIEYVLTVEGPEPIQKMSHKIDYEHYVEKQLRPIADSILDFFNTNFDDVVKGSRQQTLFGF
ncbi:DNA polymerase II [Candidatus Woesearchaeota archaeon]|nr:DNA polymerase II [Candidatus Woesearchaeota archaeon]